MKQAPNYYSIFYYYLCKQDWKCSTAQLFFSNLNVEVQVELCCAKVATILKLYTY